MKKKKLHKTNAIRLVEQLAIQYKEYEFDWNEDHLDTETVAKKLTINHAKIFKTLVTLGNKTGPIVAVIPGNKTVDLKKLALVSGNKKIEMLPQKLLEETTGYIRGGCSPVGMKKLFPTYFAMEATILKTVIVSAGKRGRQIELSTEALIQLTNGKFAEITQ